MSRKIHPTAVIAPSAELGEDVEIGPYTIVGERVRIGDRTRIGPQVMIEGVTTLGEDNLIIGQSSLGTPPQDLSYKGEPTELVMGDRNTVREFVTINRGTSKGGGVTRVGSDCLFMACCHVAHDCELQDRVILANCALLAGHVFVGQGAGISGGSVAHHFITIGRFAYIGGMSRMSQDVPPFMLIEGHPARVRKVNKTGLQRAGFTPEQIESLDVAYRQIFRSAKARKLTLEELKAAPELSDVVRELIESLEHQEQGQKGRYRESLRAQFARDGARRLDNNGHASL